MAKFDGLTLTNGGYELITASQAGQALVFTRFALGAGQVEASDKVREFTALKDSRLSLPVHDIKNNKPGETEITAIVSNAGVETGFFARELGIFARLGDSGKEQLYAYTNAGNYSDYMPDKTTPVNDNKIKLTLIVGEASSVTAVIDSTITYQTEKDVVDKITAHDTNTTAHENLMKAHNADTAAHESIVTVINKRIDDTATAAKKQGGVTLGTIMPFLVTRIPDGWLSCENGAEVSRAAYPDLWTWVQSNAPILTEENWQAAAKLQTSVGYYSSGDGSTTFRLPRLLDFVQGGVLADSGKFIGAGLPNITGETQYFLRTGGSGTPTGALSGSTETTMSYGGGASYGGINIIFDASKSNPVYGKSTTVQPASVKMVYCVRAFSAAVNQGTVDITALSDSLNNKLSISDIPSKVTGRIIAQSLGDTAGWIKYDTGVIWQYGYAKHGTSFVFPVSLHNVCAAYTIKSNGSSPTASAINFSTTAAVPYFSESDAAGKIFVIGY